MGPMKCLVDLNIERLAAPGAWFSSKEDVYLTVRLFGEEQSTRAFSTYLPKSFFDENFRFEKTYFTALDEADVALFLEDEIVTVELCQFRPYSDISTTLATYNTTAKEFLFPYSSLYPTYTSASREAFMSGTYAWNGRSPRLEFTTSSYVVGTGLSVLDPVEDAILEEKLTRRGRSRSRSRTRSGSLSRSPSRTRLGSLSRSRSLTRTTTTLPVARYRSISPVRYRSTSPLTVRPYRYSSYYDQLEVDLALARERGRARARAIYGLPYTYYSPTLGTYRTMDDLDLSLSRKYYWY
ncbi:motile cilium assembly [Mactra antiquata]